MVVEVVSWPAKMKVLIWSMAVARNVGSMAILEDEALPAEDWNSFWDVLRASVTTERLPVAGLDAGFASPFACDLLKRASSSSPIRRASLRLLNQILRGRRRWMVWSGLAS